MRARSFLPILLLPALALLIQPEARVEQIEEPPAAPREFRAAWIATVDNIDWPTKRTLSVDQQKKELINLLDLAKRLRLNAVILQVRPSADALYPSPHEPWSEYLTAVQGRGPKPPYDPLEFAVDEAHKRGLELHAWFNPYRAWHSAGKSAPHPTHITKKKPHLTVTYGNQKWLDPGEPEVQRHSLNVMLDVVKRYDIDGVHIDDYFYPYPLRSKGKTIPFPDDRSWKKYVAGGGKINRGDWRRQNVDRFVEKLYGEIKREKRHVKFGISPFGIYRSGIPSGIKAGIDQYGELYADAKKWLNEGWCDYYTPQLYWKINKKEQSYPVLLKWWMGQNTKNRHMWIGNSSSNLFTTKDWQPGELVDQIRLTREAGAGGNVFFSIKAFRQNSRGVNQQFISGPYRGAALVPASPWLDSEAPAPPRVSLSLAGDRLRMTVVEADREVNQLAIYVKTSAGWSLANVLDARTLNVDFEREGVLAIAVSALDRASNESPRIVLKP